jgi:hypothetical protein
MDYPSHEQSNLTLVDQFLISSPACPICQFPTSSAGGLSTLQFS